MESNNAEDTGQSRVACLEKTDTTRVSLGLSKQVKGFGQLDPTLVNKSQAQSVASTKSRDVLLTENRDDFGKV